MLSLSRYYVRPCSKPQKRAAIALAVRVGSVVETEEERGIAHILEHLVRITVGIGGHGRRALFERISGGCWNDRRAHHVHVEGAAAAVERLFRLQARRP